MYTRNNHSHAPVDGPNPVAGKREYSSFKTQSMKTFRISNQQCRKTLQGDMFQRRTWSYWENYAWLEEVLEIWDSGLRPPPPHSPPALIFHSPTPRNRTTEVVTWKTKGEPGGVDSRTAGLCLLVACYWEGGRPGAVSWEWLEVQSQAHSRPPGSEVRILTRSLGAGCTLTFGKHCFHSTQPVSSSANWG